MNELTAADIEARFAAVGDVLAEGGEETTILVVGGAALLLRGEIDRLTTVDVDVLARVEDGAILFPYPFADELQFPAALQDAVNEVAASYGLSGDWMNGQVALFWRQQWPEGLPDRLLDDVEWREYGALKVGLASRLTLIAMKVRALATQVRYEMEVRRETHSTVESLETIGAWIPGLLKVRRHLDDLLALTPTDAELDEVKPWIWTNANHPDFSFAINAVVHHVRTARR
jgi:hypothetical protein